MLLLLHKGMHFSGRITNSYIAYLEGKGVERQQICALTDLSEEFLTDPTTWLSASEVEDFLEKIESHFKSFTAEASLSETVGAESATLNSWGGLSGVLKLMSNPQDIFTQPQKFFSYFISPEPPVGEIEIHDIDASTQKVRFSFPISRDEYPRTVEFLKASLESLPIFMNTDPSTVVWDNNEIEILWSSKQEELFQEKEKSVSPEFIKNLIENLEQTEKDLQKKSRLLHAKEQRIRSLEMQLSQANQPEAGMGLNSEAWVQTKGQMYRFKDYICRAQQIITLLTGKRPTATVSKLLRRLDWDQIVNQYPKDIDAFIAAIESKEFSAEDKQKLIPKNFDVKNTMLEEVVTTAVDTVKSLVNPEQDIHTLCFLNQPLKLSGNFFEQALVDLISESVSHPSAKKDQSLRVVTRPQGKMAQVEVSDSRDPIIPEEFFESELGQKTQVIMQMHNGVFDVKTHPTGNTFILGFPL